MADDNNQQDMSMEDILSSIKNILEEDEAVSRVSPDARPQPAAEQNPPVEPEEGETVRQPVRGTEEESDILELSPDMRLPEISDDSSARDINLDDELNNIKLPELADENEALPATGESPDADADNPEDDEPRGVRVGWEDFESDPFYEEPAERDREEIIQITEGENFSVADVLPVPAETVSETGVLSSGQNVNLPEEISPAPAGTETGSLPVEEAEAGAVPAGVPEALPEIEEPAETVSGTDAANSSDAGTEVPDVSIEETKENMSSEADEYPSVPNQARDVSNEETSAEESAKEETDVVREAAADSAVDVSASIISNFAKMFSKTEPVTATEPAAPVAAAVEPVSRLGDSSRTIEDVVASVVRQIIGDEVAANWKEGMDYDVLARQEIARQTREWLDDNLPAVVEKIVKQEIERVMAKVGS